MLRFLEEPRELLPASSLNRWIARVSLTHSKRVSRPAFL
ncbi:hypothetical protein CLOLEP_00743 [[Clostridium] leptum DSM 753]|uniref:Uncharacterized protein n=1 Tax=[Clostridium] leptum DSM 753 TaxID=428125 RepID=A7VQB5_9FIRM|nr:hypothetical protein CLOLEP_00743 [[Clostridium] leptum DSM 753]